MRRGTPEAAPDDATLDLDTLHLHGRRALPSGDATSARPQYGVPGGLERWEHLSYRWRRGLEAVTLLVAALVLAPHLVATASSAGTTAAGCASRTW